MKKVILTTAILMAILSAGYVIAMSALEIAQRGRHSEVIPQSLRLGLTALCGPPPGIAINAAAPEGVDDGASD